MSVTNSIVSEMRIEDITVLDDFNARQHDGAIEDLAVSIRLAGLLIPLIVNDRGELLAGHRRLQAARLAGLTTIPVTVQEGDGHSAIGTSVHAIENIARQQLTPAEEATAIQRMLDHGYTPDGASQVLAMPLARVTRRLTLLQLPDEIRALWGPGDEAGASVTAAPIAADVLRKIPALADLMLQGHRLTVRGIKTERGEPVDLHIDRLAREPQRYLYRLHAACTGDRWQRVNAMPAWPENVILCPALQPIGGNTLQKLKIDGKIRGRHTRLTREANDVYIYNFHPQITTDDMDAARAAGVTLTLPPSDDEDAIELIFDREWLTARITDEIFPRWEKQILTRIKRKQAEIAKTQKTADAGGKTGKDGTQLTDSELREKRVRTIEREANKRWKAAAEPANLDLGRVLLDRLSDVEVTADIARLFAIQSLGPRPPKTKPTYGTERRDAATLAAAGLRYVMPGWQTQQPKPTKAEPDRTVTTYLDQEEAEKKLWQWFDLAKTPGEIFGRALIIHAAARWANEIVVPQADRKMSSSMGWVTGRTKLTHESYLLMEKIVRSEKALPASVKKLIKEMTSFDAGKLEAAERSETAPDAPEPAEGAVSA